jgi:predicted RNA-binding protein (virulence factor B family)
MVQLGTFCTLEIIKKTDFGYYLDGDNYGEILLPKRYMTSEMSVGKSIRVFIYLDGEERIVASTETPTACVGDFAFLKVKSVEQIGAFVEWLENKDLLVPFKEQKIRMEAGKSYVVYVYEDKVTNRVAASMKLEKYFSKTTPDYRFGEEVDLLIWTPTDLGYKVIADGKYLGLIYKNEIFTRVQTGQKVKGYIKKLREDGKLDISLQAPGYQRINPNAEKIIQMLKKAGGFLPYNDKSDAEIVYAIFQMSKKTFKQAIGNLYKSKTITIENDGIRMVFKESKS